jgi:Nif-specific regulatory protein
LRVVVGRALERQALERENRALRQQLQRRYHLNGIVGTSAAMLDVFDAVRRVADTPLTVILQGESGTGKGLFARAIHYNSSRKDGPFLAVNCSAFPETLLEAELFGHEKGAFTGASHDRVGRFEAANGGTLFLDEVACITPAIQIKLLRVLEERTIERLGSNRTRLVDIRLVVASNEDLERMVREGSFREDFYFRVRGFPIVLPALRERVEDIPLLATQFLKRTCDERRVPLKNLDSRARAMLMTRPWPGNVRELRSVIETLVLMVDDATIAADDITRMFPSPNEVEDAAQAARKGFKQAVESYEKRLLLDAIHREDGVKARAARRLGLDPGQMKYLSRKYEL